MKLKPCPFCGESKLIGIVRSEPRWKEYFFHIHCHCCCSRAAEYENEKEAIAAWNKRVEPKCNLSKYADGDCEGFMSNGRILETCIACKEFNEK